MVAPQSIEPVTLDVGMLIRRPPHEVFEALADPAITTRYWFTGSTGRMDEGAKLTWTWDMYGASREIQVEKVEKNRLIRFTWNNYEVPTTVEFSCLPFENNTTYLRITETGYAGELSDRIIAVRDSTAGFAFMISGLKAVLERDIELGLVVDEHPPNLKLD
ncbi:polyketide cyclase [Nocardia panacis]|uniref:Polyketide cyclase n=1 Tax=Nocardia panacis TaxID=2340916 RepID=A0A3A4K3B4_9NOCA|nr:SRPBCC family protein [Nocardia panacis]RJO72509.1 polyketide cyclase [Nocardia panacis]